MNVFQFSSRIFSSFALVLFATLALLGCGETSSGTDSGSTDISEFSSDSGDGYITIIEKKSSSSSASVHCVTIGGRQLDCDNVQSLDRVSSSSIAEKKSNVKSPKGYFIDSRNNRLYKTIELVKLTWFAENVNLDGNEYFDATEALYACPAGTHLPIEKEWSIMLGIYTEPEIEESGLYYHYVGTALKSTESWLGRDNGTNELMFDAKANGYMLDDELYFVGLQANFWTSTATKNDSVKSVLITANDHYAAIVNKQKAYKLAVRCVVDNPNLHYFDKADSDEDSDKSSDFSKSSSSAANSSSSTESSSSANSSSSAKSSSSSSTLIVPSEIMPAGTFNCEEEECVDRSALDASVSYNEFKDPRDSKVYSVFAIERLNDKNEKYNMYWFAQNLDYNADGSACAFADEDDISCEKYGRMYYLGLANKVCPEGWRLPTTDEIKFINYANVAVSLFGFKPNGEFNSTKETYISVDRRYAKFWTSTTSEKSSELANLFVYDFNNDVILFDSITYKSYYLPVRCVMDSQTESNP